MSRPERGCAACHALTHSLTSCDTEAAAQHYERIGRHADAAKVRRRIAREEGRAGRRVTIEEWATRRRA